MTDAEKEIRDTIQKVVDDTLSRLDVRHFEDDPEIVAAMLEMIGEFITTEGRQMMRRLWNEAMDAASDAHAKEDVCADQQSADDDLPTPTGKGGL